METDQTKNLDVDSANLKEKILHSVKNLKVFLDQTVNDIEEISNFLNQISLLVVDLIKLIEDFCNNKNLSRQQYFSVVVYLVQYCFPYQLFKDSFKYHSLEEGVVLEIKRCICKQLTMILDNIEIALNPADDTSIGSFLNLMDLILDKVAAHDITQNQKLRQDELNMISYIVEEILCLSMSVAHVAFGDDNKIITASCRSVLNSVENLKIEVNKANPNKDMCNLVIDICSDTLCSSEAKVNTAVLRLCLNVFSECKKPMKNLYDACKQLQEYDKSTLEPIITEFDLHMDRIFQICTFSIASSTMGKRVAEIKNAMANLEFLESELVPSFLAMVNHSSQNKTIFADILKKIWCRQMEALHKTVHGIIEPSAYCKLIYDELDQEIENLWKGISMENQIKISSVDLFVLYTKELVKMFTECMDSFENKDDIRKQLKVVNQVLHELVVAKNLLCNSTLENSTNLRIFKRCKVLLGTIKKLYRCINKMEESKLLSSNEENVKNQTFVKIKTPQRHIKDADDVLEGIITKSKQLVKDRSICHFSRTFTFDQSVNGITKLTTGNRTRLVKISNLREYSYRQSQTTTNKLKDLSEYNLWILLKVHKTC